MILLKIKDKELRRLNTIVQTIDKMKKDEQSRTMIYLNNKYK